MIVLAIVSGIGFLCALTLHIASGCGTDLLGLDVLGSFDLTGWLLFTPMCLGMLLFLYMLIHAWAWNWSEFWDNLTDGMSGLAMSFLVVIFCYNLLLLRSARAHAATTLISALFMLFCYAPTVYFWKERPMLEADPATPASGEGDADEFDVDRQ